MPSEIWTLEESDVGPLVGVALHDGHEVRPEVEDLLALTPEERRREEDPYTGGWTRVAPTRVVLRRSRFEVDMNRTRTKAVYRTPDEAWGLRVWASSPPPGGLVERSRRLHDLFYERMHRLLADRIRRNGRVVVYDIHSYNHRRRGPDAPPEPPSENPDVNLGTGSLDRERWGRVADAFMETLRERRVDGRSLDVRENVRFRGGHFVDWIHATFPERACGLAIEVKKFFMDEWTGEPRPEILGDVEDALAATVEPVLAALEEAA